MTFYIILSILLILLASAAQFSNGSNRLFINVALFTILLSVSALRYEVGADFEAYEDYYNTLISADQIEPFYFFLVKTLRFFGFSSVSFFIVTALATLALIWYGIKQHSNHFYVSLLLFVFLGMYTESFNIVRHFVALSVMFCFGYGQLKERNLKGYILVVLIACLFHMSALFCLPFYFLSGRKISTWLAIGGVVFAFALNSGFLIGDITSIVSLVLPAKYAGYIQYLPDYIYALDEPFWLKIVNNADKILICFLLFRYRKRLTEGMPGNLVLINLAYFNLVFAFFSRGIGPLQRLGFYFSIFSILSIPLLIQLGRGKMEKLVIASAIVLMYFIYFIATFLQKNIGDIIPYQTIFG